MSNPEPSFAVPKFGSFKPKSASEPQKGAEEDTRSSRHASTRESREHRKGNRHRDRSRSRERKHSDRKRDRSRDRRRHDRSRSPRRHHRDRSRSPRRRHSHDRDDHRRRDDERNRHQGRHRSKSKDRRESRSVKSIASIIEPAPDPQDEQSASSFIIDRKGDVQNLIYGKMHRYNVPPFRRIGYGSVMGINRNFKIDREKPDYIVLIGPRATSTVEREKYVFAKNEKKGAKLLRLKPGVAMPDELKSNDDFVSLGAVKRKREGEDSSDDSEAEHTHYRSIEGKAKPRTLPEDEKFEYLSASESDSEARRTVEIDEDARKEYVILSRAVNANKEDIEAWMALIHHQENMLGLNGRRKRTDAERRSTAEIKLDMYKKALKSCGTTLQNRERIILGIIEEGAKIWSPGEQAKRWEKVMKAEPQSDLLWRRYQESRIQ